MTKTYIVHTLLRARDWQHRPQLDEVRNWWSEGGRGVCALVGMGGAGKTAIAERFLNDLLDDVVHDLPQPENVFVYSFYDDDKPENFFRDLQIWLEGTSSPDKRKSSTQLIFDIQQHKGLIILDGLEKVQESGARGGFGRLTSSSLRDLLNHIASGSARHVSVLVTSRFPLTDLRDSQPRYFRTIDVDQISVEAGIALLRARGVHGTYTQLEPIVEHCGRHALTVDLAGGYIKEYGQGDPSTPLNLGTAEELLADAEQELDDDKRRVLLQSRRFTRIAERYRKAMLENDEAALALVERICLFRLNVDTKMLTAIFTGQKAESISGKALASLNTGQLQQKLDWLVQMRIVEHSKCVSLTSESRELGSSYSIHPAVREGFFSSFSLSSRQKEENNEQIRQGLVGLLPGRYRSQHDTLASIPVDNELAGKLSAVLEAVTPGTILSAKPGTTFPSEPHILDLFEEIVYHTIESGRIAAAWDIYLLRIGGYTNLGWALADYERGKRICEKFDLPDLHSRVDLPTELVQQIQLYLLYEYSLYLKNSGDFEKSIDRSKAHRDTAQRAKDNITESIAERGLCDVFRLTGRLGSGIASGNRSVSVGRDASAEIRSNNYGFRGNCLIESGRIRQAQNDFSESLRCQCEQEGAIDINFLTSQRAVRFINLLIRLGRVNEARQLATSNIEIVNRNLGNKNQWTTTFRLFLAELAILEHDSEDGDLQIEIDTSSIQDRSVPIWQIQVAIVQSRAEISRMKGLQFEPKEMRARTESAIKTLKNGLKVTRNFGFGLFHIDLLLERARLHLLRGDPDGALNDIEVALDTGIAANDTTGQPELLAARDPECGYAWAIPVGLQLRAEALLLRAAQTLGRDAFDPTKVSELPADVQEKINQAKDLLQEALDLWQPLHDPDPERDDQNFKLDGKEYNYKADETYNVLAQLEGGVLTRYPLKTFVQETEREETPVPDKTVKVFFSYAHEDEKYKDELIKHLSILKRQSVIDVWHDRIIAGGDEWAGEIDDNLEDADVILLLVSSDFLASDYCYDVEMKRALERHDVGEARVIPVILRTVDWTGAPFGKLQARPKDAKPVDQWPNQDEAFTDIAKGIRNAIENP